MDQKPHCIAGIDADDKDHLVGLLRSHRYREVGILDTPGEFEYCARASIRDFNDQSDLVWTVVFGNGYERQRS